MAILAAGCLKKPGPRSGEFQFKVIDSQTREPISGVAVSIGDYHLQTDRTGLVRIADLPPGDYAMRLERQWYPTADFTVHYVGRPVEDIYLTSNIRLQGAILYSGDRSGNRDIYQLDLASRSVTQLVDYPSHEGEPVPVSSTAMIFTSNANSENEEDLYLYQAGSPAQALCSSGKTDNQPTVDQDGKILIFHSTRNTTGRIYQYSLSTSVPTRSAVSGPVELTEGYEPAINPSGTWVAYINSNQLWVAKLTGSGLSDKRALPAKLDPGNPCWSPDGEYLAFDARNEPKGPRYIFVIRMEDHAVQQVTADFGSAKMSDHRHPGWCKDEAGDFWLFFSTAIIYDTRIDIYGVKFIPGKTADTYDWLMLSGGSGSKTDPTWRSEP